MLVAHVSDLHVGRKGMRPILEKLAKSLEDPKINVVLITGDITEWGKQSEFAEFLDLFKNVCKKAIIVPGNHDKLGDDIAKFIMKERVEVVGYQSLNTIKINSTANYNKFLISGHSSVCKSVLKEVGNKINDKFKFNVIVLHHHIIRLPEETLGEHIAKKFGLPFASELRLGQELINLSLDRVDLILHGHRHVPFEITIPGAKKELGVYNAGCTPALGKYRLFQLMDWSKPYYSWIEFIRGTVL